MPIHITTPIDDSVIFELKAGMKSLSPALYIPEGCGSQENDRAIEAESLCLLILKDRLYIMSVLAPKGKVIGCRAYHQRKNGRLCS